MTDKNNSKDSRRNFIDKAVKAGTGLVAGAALVHLYSDNKENESTRLIGADGSVYEVDKKHLMKMCNGKISNAQLRIWLDEEQQKTSREL